MFPRLLAALVKIFVGAYPQWRGYTPSASQRIYFANHASHLDTLVLWSALPPALRKNTHPVAARDYWGEGLRKLVAVHGFNAVLIDRRRKQTDNDPLLPLYDILAKGESLIIFPEGTRSVDLFVRPFKSGLFHVAQRFPQIELIPVYLDNPRRCMPKGSKMPLPLICTARFGPPTNLRAGETKADFLRRAQRMVVDLA